MKVKLLSTIVIFAFVTTLTSCAKTTKTNSTSTSKPEVSVKKVEQTLPTIKKVEIKEFQDLTQGKAVQLVDVRTPDEFSAGHLENATNVNVFDSNFIEQMTKYSKDQPVYVYCRSGGRSMKAARLLKDKGYNVVNMNGGFMSWSKNGYKSVK